MISFTEALSYDAKVTGLNFCAVVYIVEEEAFCRDSESL